MAFEDKEDRSIYKVVLNQEEQYSIWPVDKEIPRVGRMRVRKV
jgi:MbtH protein